MTPAQTSAQTHVDFRRGFRDHRGIGATRSVCAAAALAALLAIDAGACAADGDPTYVLSGTLVLGGPGGCDGIDYDIARHRIFVARGDRLQIVDGSGLPLADVACGTGLRSPLLVAGRVYVADGKAPVQVIDAATATVVGGIVIAGEVTGLASDQGGAIYASLHDGKTLVAFAAGMDPGPATAPPIALGGTPSAVVAGHGFVYAGLDDRDEIAVVTAATGVVSARWSLGAGHHPVGMASDPDGSHLFVACADRHLLVIDTATGAIHGDLPTGADPGDCVFTGSAVVVACAGGVLTVARPAGPGGYTVVQSLALPPGARHVAVDAQGVLYLPTAQHPAGAEAHGEGGFRLLLVTRLPQLP